MKLPPFAKRLRKSESLVWVFAGPLAWEWVERDTRNKLALPPNDSPLLYHWPVAAKDVIVLDTGSPDTELRRLAWALLSAGACRVGCIPLEGPYVLFSQRGMRHAA